MDNIDKIFDIINRLFGFGIIVFGVISLILDEFINLKGEIYSYYSSILFILSGFALLFNNRYVPLYVYKILYGAGLILSFIPIYNKWKILF